MNIRAVHTPKNRRIYAIGDVHGMLDLAEDVLAQIKNDIKTRPPKKAPAIVFLGDYIDRGPHSAQVLDRLAKLKWPGADLHCLKGNHETYILEFLEKPLEIWPRWSVVGGSETLRSFGITLTGRNADKADILTACKKLNQKIPDSTRKFLGGLALSWQEGGYVFVHAGIRPGVDLAQQKASDLLWIRDGFLDYDKSFGPFVVVHGHTPKTKPVERNNRIGIDTKAFYSGTLTCLVLDGEARAILQSGRSGLLPLSAPEGSKSEEALA